MSKNVKENWKPIFFFIIKLDLLKKEFENLITQKKPAQNKLRDLIPCNCMKTIKY